MAECKKCKLLEKKENVIYEDDIAIAVLGRAAVGHVKVYPKKHVVKLEELDDKEAEHLFIVASYAATMVFEALGGQGGTNILVKNMPEEQHVTIDVVPRTAGDDFNFQWEPKEIDEKDMKDAGDRIKDKCDFIGHDKKSEKKEGEAPKALNDKNKKELDEDSYLVKHLKRIP
ncbi:HIT domain-containing protein [Candidatus Woesearchaeota archaeon]|nr:HIT domain-containing protein [Candidatus Woesearchaeota archaeon]